MNYSTILTDELIDIREIEYKHKNYLATDAIRIELDSRGSFVMDTPNGQVIYHMGIDWANNRTELILNIKSINENFYLNSRR